MKKRIYKIWVARDLFVAYANGKGEIIYKLGVNVNENGSVTDGVLKALGYEVISYLLEPNFESECVINEVIEYEPWDFSETQLKEIKGWVLDNEWTILSNTWEWMGAYRLDGG